MMRPRAILERLSSRLTEKEKFCLDAYLVNNEREKAYLYSRDTPSTAKESSLSTIVSRWINSEPVIAYLELMSAKTGITSRVKTEEMDEQDKMFERIVELLKGFSEDESDKKLALQAAKELSVLYQLRDKPKDESERHKMYYLPLRCYDCAAYKYVKERVADKQQLAETPKDDD